MIGVIENAILARMKAASGAKVLGYTLKDVDSLPIEIDDKLPERITQFPSAWTVFGGFRPVAQFTSGDEVRGTFHVVVAAQNLRNDRATRFGGSDDEVGSYQMIADVAGLVVGEDFGLAIKPFALGVCTPLYTGQTDKNRRLSLMALELTTDFVFEQVEATPPNVGDFKTFHVDWDVRPFGGIDADPGKPGVQLPDDEHADAVTHQILET